MMRAALLTLALGAAAPAGAYTVVRGVGQVGDQPSVFGGYDMPASELNVLPMESSLPPKAISSSLAPREIASDLPVSTRESLSALGAKQQGDQIFITLPGDVLFDFDKADIREDAEPVLIRLAELLLSMPDAPVKIIGHTDAKGDDAYNDELSERRAASVFNWLVGLGLQPEQMTHEGRGESDPVAPNQQPDGSDDPEGRQQNRRVDFVIGTKD